MEQENDFPSLQRRWSLAISLISVGN